MEIRWEDSQKKPKFCSNEVVEKQWGASLIESWNKNWYNKSVELGNKIAKIIGAQKEKLLLPTVLR